MTERRKADISISDNYLKFRFRSKDSPECIMTLRSAGNMGRNTDKDTESRKKILRELGVENLYKLHQIHSRDVFNADELDKGSIAEGDGLFTFRKENVLSVTIADCMPVFFYSRSESVFGVLHSGWKGTGISIEALNSIENYTGRIAEDFEFILGPSIGPCCYEVDPERAGIFRNLYGSKSVIRRVKHSGKYQDIVKISSGDDLHCMEKVSSSDISEISGTYHADKNIINRKAEDKGRAAGKEETAFYLDLRKANVSILEKKGIKNITVMENCTCCSENFYSFRGDGPEQFGLMLALIGYFR